ncbi:MAG TPA: SDR family oxidoreductase [Chlorobiota bacterium]|nr:SDR family oxidoreductase [Chlorobiota bacterium]
MASDVVIITGASGGIGRELVGMCLANGFIVVAAAREDSLLLLSKAGLHPSDRLVIMPLDVRDDGDIDRVVTETFMRFGRIDALVNNAGISFRGVAEHMTSDEELEQMAVNYFGPMMLIRRVLPHMRHRRAGRIINVSSVGGMMAMPTMSSYSASKWALEGASEALWYELRPWNVSVTLVQPGFIRSDAFRKVRLPQAFRADGTEDDYGILYSSMTSFVERLMVRSPSTSKSVARVILRQLVRKRPPLRVQATLDAWLFHYLRRFLPRRFYHPLLYHFLPNIRKWGS